MKVAIIGYGQMGQMIHQCAQEQQIEVTAIIDPVHQDATHRTINSESLANADAAICFTMPEVALENIKEVAATKTHLVMGTTGWLDHLDEVTKLIEKQNIGMVYSSNFSLGVNIFFKIIEQAAAMIDQFDAYDVMAIEEHHKKKRDSPSGTAITMGELLLDKLSRKDKLVTDKLDRMPEENELHFASVRGGHIPGTHKVLFDSEFDTIELTHRARNRKGFASGSLVAANWIKGQKGMYTEREMMDHLLG